MLESYLWLMVVVIAYFAPTFTAKRGRRGGVFVINLFLGWTAIGWVVAMYLALRTLETAKGGA